MTIDPAVKDIINAVLNDSNTGEINRARMKKLMEVLRSASVPPTPAKISQHEVIASLNRVQAILKVDCAMAQKAFGQPSTGVWTAMFSLISTLIEDYKKQYQAN